MWRYFIELIGPKYDGDYVQSRETEDGLPLCRDLNYAIDFETADKLLEWVRNNTSLKPENEEFSMRVIFFPNYDKTGCW